MRVFGIGYKIDNKADRHFDLSCTYAFSTSENGGSVRLPITWHFQYPVADGAPIHFGASETLGMLGGVKDQRQFSYSEAIERAIGDGLTHFVCEILDSFRDDAIHILIFGLAFPKLVGRLLTLRPPLQTRIYWVCPIPFPEWITEGINESILLAAFGAGFGTDWEDEPLINARRYAPRNSREDVLIQELMLSGHQSETILPASYDWIKNALCSALLPREILVAAGQVQNHLDSPYTAGEEVVLRSVPKQFLDAAVYETAQHQRPHVIPGWDVRWKEHVKQ